MYRQSGQENVDPVSEPTFQAQSVQELTNGKLVSIRAKSVRIFVISSYRSDFQLERDTFWDEVAPELKHYCLNFGADLSIVDPYRNGTRNLDEDPFLLETFLDEIRRSNNDYFLCLIGDKCDSETMPTKLPCKQFKDIRKRAFETSKDIRLLDECYKLDNNLNPEMYTLTRSRSTKNLDAKSRQVLLDIIQSYDDPDVTINQDNQALRSSFELIIDELIRAKAKNVHSIVRNFEDGWKSKRTEDGAEIGNLTKQMTGIKNTINTHFDRNSLITFIVKWPNEMDFAAWKKSKECEKYLLSFAQQTTVKLKQLITSDMSSWPMSSFDDPIIQLSYNQSLVHWNWLMSNRRHPACSWGGILDKLKEMINIGVKDGVLIRVQGDECSGRTTLLSELAGFLPNWLSCPKMIFRAVQLTACSYFAHEFWTDICTELSQIYRLDGTGHLSELFTRISSSGTHPLVLLIDDINLLKYCVTDDDEEDNVRTRPFSCLRIPSNVVVIVTTCVDSTVSGRNVVNLPEFSGNGSNTVKMPTFSEDELLEIVKGTIDISGRRLSPEQICYVKRRFSHSKSPFLAILIVEETSRWTSGFRPKWPTKNTDGVKDPLTDTIVAKLEQLEMDHGMLLVKIMAQYLSVSSHGLSEVELTDVLSSNGELAFGSNGNGFDVIDWLAIKQDLGSLLKTVIFDNRCLFDWSHQLVGNIVRHRYLQNTSDLKKCHSDLVDLFGDLLSELSIHSMCIDDRSQMSFSSSDFRLSQPLKTGMMTGEDPQFSLRRVRNLWYHLLHSGNIDSLKELALCNFYYLDAVLQSYGLAHLLTIFESVLQQVLHHDLQLLYDRVIVPAVVTLTKDRDQMAAEVIGRLRYTKAENSHVLNTLVNQAMSWVDTYSKQPLLVPLISCVKPPKIRQVLRLQLDNWQSTKTVIQPTFNHQHLLVAGNSTVVGSISMYHLASKTLVRTFTGHTARVTSISLSRSGSFFATTSIDQSVRIWDLLHGLCLRTFTPHSGRILCSLITHDDCHLISGSADSTAKMVAIETGQVVCSFNDHTGPVSVLVLTSTNEFLITGSGDFVAIVWNLDTGEPVHRMGGLMAPIACMAVTNNDAFLAVSCEDETLRVFSLCSAAELHQLSRHDGKVFSLVAAHDECQLFAGCAQGNIYCYDVHNGQVLDVFQSTGNNAVTDVKVTDDNCILISASNDWINVWNIDQINPRHLHHLLDNTECSISSIAMSDNQKHAACGTTQSTVALWDLEMCQCAWTAFHRRKCVVTVLDFTRLSSSLISGDSTGLIAVWDMTNGALIREYQSHQASICGIQTVHDDSRILSIDTDDVMRIWPLKTAENSDNEIIVNGPRGEIRLCTNDEYLISRFAFNPKEAKIWKLTSEGLVPKAKILHNNDITCMDMAANGRLLVSGSLDQSLKVWSVDTGFLTQILVGHEGAVLCCAIADDEQVVVSGATDHSILVWKVTTGATLHSLDGHRQANITAVDITCDGSVAFSADDAGWVFCWSIEHGCLLSCFNAHQPVVRLVTSSDANRILLQLDLCSQLPIICLHNTPANLLMSQVRSGSVVDFRRRDSSRTHSISSIGSNMSVGSTQGPFREQFTVMTMTGNSKMTD